MPTRSYSNVTVEATESMENKKNPGKKLYLKKHYCVYCGKCQQQIIRHIETKHSREPEVKALGKVHSAERAKLTKILKYKGNFVNNIKVLRDDSGSIIVVRRPSDEEDPSKYYPCTECYGFFSKFELYRHSCVATRNIKEKHLLRDSKTMLASAINTPNPDLAKVIASMRDDEITQVVKNDSLIKKFLSDQLDRYDNRQQKMVRQRARDIARLLHHVRESDNDLADLELRHLLTPSRFDLIIESVKKVAMKDGKDAAGYPLKLGQIIPAMIATLHGESIRTGDLDLEDKCKRFSVLMANEWSSKISLKSRKKLRDRKLNKTHIIPKANQVTLLGRELGNEVEEAYKAFKKEPGVETGRRLSESLLCQVLVFNKRRGGEASRLEFKIYQEKSEAWGHRDLESELWCALEEHQKKSAEWHLMVRTIGKCGTHVPIIFTYRMKIMADDLIKYRHKLGFPEDNPFLFGIPGHKTHLGAWQTLNTYCKKFNINGVTSTSLRRYLATTAQALDLSDQDIGHLAHHMGHTPAVHRRDYRKNHELTEVGKIAALLHASQEGTVHLQKGRTLDTLELPANWDLRETPLEDYESDGSNEDEPQEDKPNEEAVIDDPQPGSSKRKTRDTKKLQEQFQVNIDSKERSQIIEYFSELIRAGKRPGKKQCTHYIEEKNSLLEWKQVKSAVHGKILSQQKKGKDVKRG